MGTIDNNNRITLTEFKEFLVKPIIGIEDLEDFRGEPLKKILPYWRKYEFVPFIPKGKWIRVSFADLMWFKVLDTLREFGYSLSNTKKITDYFFKDAYLAKLPELNLEHNKKILQTRAVAGTITQEEKVMLDEITSMLKDKHQTHTLRFRINYFTNLIDLVLNNGVDIEILIFLDGSVGESHGGSFYSHKNKAPDFQRPHIRLSLKSLLEEFIKDEELSMIVTPTLLDEKELKVLEALRKKDLRELVIKFNNDKIVIQSKKDGVIKGEDAQKIKKLLGMKNYEEITLKTMDHSSLSFRKTNKK